MNHIANWDLSFHQVSLTHQLAAPLPGLFMIPGRKGLLGRGALIAALGAAVPIGYVVLSGGPEAKGGASSATAAD